MKRPHPRDMTPEERVAEVAEILATAYLRLCVGLRVPDATAERVGTPPNGGSR